MGGGGLIFHRDVRQVFLAECVGFRRWLYVCWWPDKFAAPHELIQLHPALPARTRRQAPFGMAA
jgi:hypothetical protein